MNLTHIKQNNITHLFYIHLIALTIKYVQKVYIVLKQLLTWTKVSQYHVPTSATTIKQLKLHLLNLTK